VLRATVVLYSVKAVVTVNAVAEEELDAAATGYTFDAMSYSPYTISTPLIRMLTVVEDAPPVMV
jgi:hypothetical protein